MSPEPAPLHPHSESIQMNYISNIRPVSFDCLFLDLSPLSSSEQNHLALIHQLLQYSIKICQSIVCCLPPSFDIDNFVIIFNKIFKGLKDLK